MIRYPIDEDVLDFLDRLEHMESQAPASDAVSVYDMTDLTEVLHDMCCDLDQLLSLFDTASNCQLSSESLIWILFF